MNGRNNAHTVETRALSSFSSVPVMCLRRICCEPGYRQHAAVAAVLFFRLKNYTKSIATGKICKNSMDA